MSHTAVVILNYNGENLLKQFLPSVIQHSENAEVIVADNGSTDESIRVLEAQFPAVRVIKLGHNYGFCGGYNRALKQVQADYYVLLNSDIEVTPKWLTPMVDLLDKNNDMATVQPKILSYSKRNYFEYAGAAGGLIDSFGYPFCRGRIFDHAEEDDNQYNDIRPVFWSTGACMMIRAEMYHRFNGLDEDFFAHMEEIDLCWKIHRAGQKVMYCGHSTVYHLGAGTLNYLNPRKTYLNFRNGLFLVYRHFSSLDLLVKFPVRIGLDWLAGLVFLLKGQHEHAKAVLDAHADFLKHLNRERQKRRALHRDFPRYDDNMIYKGSIVFDFFILKKRQSKG
ncbi:MAG TPA: glycosyltransferase family 2 protein [Ohtaekwangia sp.]|nr:glycosyltransferase family 2 protein [Ohtaekwangia sp.]